MHKHVRKTLVALAVSANLIAMPIHSTHATGIPVVDVAALVQAVQQVMTAYEQLTELQNQLKQAERAYDAVTGTRGMSALLDNPALRSYLPTDMQSILEGLDGDIDKYRSMGRLLENDRWQKAAMQAAEILENAEVSAATDLANSETVYERAGDRIDEYQDFVDEIDGATDPKAIADLQARIQAENVFLQNEIIRLQAMQMAQHAKRDMREVRMQEKHVNMTGPTNADYSGIMGSIE